LKKEVGSLVIFLTPPVSVNYIRKTRMFFDKKVRVGKREKEETR